MTDGIRIQWAPCTRHDCHDLPLHTHTRIPFPPERTAGRPYAPTHHYTADIDRIYIDWRALTYELTTGHPPPPPQGQLTLEGVSDG
jgi:hypothetical protein